MLINVAFTELAKSHSAMPKWPWVFALKQVTTGGLMALANRGNARDAKDQRLITTVKVMYRVDADYINSTRRTGALTIAPAKLTIR
ncbi:MAG TPA: hypothetical protein VGC22_10240 [Chitinophaga sp.]